MIAQLKEQVKAEGLALRERGLHKPADHQAHIYAALERIEEELNKAYNRAAYSEAKLRQYKPVQYGKRVKQVGSTLLPVMLSYMAAGDILSKPECCKAILETGYLQKHVNDNPKLHGLIADMKKTANKGSSPP